VIDFGRVAELCGGDKHVFATSAVAASCVETHVSIVDDCYSITTVFEAPVVASEAKCGTTYMIKVTATEDNECDQSSTGSFLVLVDGNIPENQGKCEFSRGPDAPPTLDVSEATDVCSGNMVFATVDAADSCVLGNSFASDDCREVELNTTRTEVTDAAEALSVCGSTYAITVRNVSCVAVDGTTTWCIQNWNSPNDLDLIVCS
jgi:hypothetical protein